MSLLMDMQSSSLADDLTALGQKSPHLPKKKTSYMEKYLIKNRTPFHKIVVSITRIKISNFHRSVVWLYSKMTN